MLSPLQVESSTGIVDSCLTDTGFQEFPWERGSIKETFGTKEDCTSSLDQGRLQGVALGFLRSSSRGVTPLHEELTTESMLGLDVRRKHKVPSQVLPTQQKLCLPTLSTLWIIVPDGNLGALTRLSMRKRRILWSMSTAWSTIFSRSSFAFLYRATSSECGAWSEAPAFAALSASKLP